MDKRFFFLLYWQDGASCFFVNMELLERKIKQSGQVIGTDILKVDSFLNHQLDIALLRQLGQDVYEHYKNCAISKILTVEASGIAYAALTAQFFDCPVVFAKKKGATNQSQDVLTAKVHSFTHGNDNWVAVDRRYIQPTDRVLLMDDFLAHGEALRGLADIVRQAGATLVGAAVAIEKGFQGGGDDLRAQGMEVYSQAVIQSMSEQGVTFRRS